MGSDDARVVLRAAIWDDGGTFTVLRLGRDPGRQRVHDLRLALRILWRHWKSCDALPFDVAHAAGTILHFQREAKWNLRDEPGSLRDELRIELDDLAQGAFELLSGPHAESEVVRRPDLGE